MNLYEILQGDALAVLAGMEADSVDMIFTDPPYGHNNNNWDLIHKWEWVMGGSKPTDDVARPIANDGPEANDLYKDALPLMLRVLKPGGCCCCCCGGGGPDPQFARWSLWMDEVFEFKQMVVWDKGPMGMGWHYRRSYEVILVGQKPGAACEWYDTTKRVENILRHIPKKIPQAEDHPTIKPVALAAHFIKLHSQAGGLVLDPFGGSGTTAVAALQNQRRAVLIELSPEYVVMAHRRIEREAGGQQMVMSE
jgi:DNA modification methylase